MEVCVSKHTKKVYYLKRQDNTRILGLDVVRDGRVLDSSASIGLFVLIEAEATDM